MAQDPGSPWDVFLRRRRNGLGPPRTPGAYFLRDKNGRPRWPSVSMQGPPKETCPRNQSSTVSCVRDYDQVRHRFEFKEGEYPGIAIE